MKECDKCRKEEGKKERKRLKVRMQGIKKKIKAGREKERKIISRRKENNERKKRERRKER